MEASKSAVFPEKLNLNILNFNLLFGTKNIRLISAGNKTNIMRNINSIFVILIVAAFSVNSGAQDMKNNKAMPMAAKASTVKTAVCIVYPTQGNNVSGTVTFTAVNGGVKVVADLQGLSKGKHGIHIHECGDCTAADGTSAGGHFNPMSKSHGAPMDAMRHEGDMGNIEADDSGKAHLEYVDNTISFEGDASIIGRSVIIHKNEDDFKTQPTGNAGARVACGVIGIGK
jgi:Cu-Zn family superoxide dismutase